MRSDFSKDLSTKVKSYWLLSRPHAFMGTLLQFIFISLCLYSQTSINLITLHLLCIVCIHIFGMTINQIADVEIDRINKPFLPLASGLISRKQAIRICVITSFLSISIASIVSPILLFSSFSLLIGLYVYSMPPFQWKRYTSLALITITSSRAIIFPLGFSLSLANQEHITHLPAEILYFSAFTFLYVSGIALAKDAPDIKGDKEYNILTLASKLGSQRILTIAFFLQDLAMGVALISLILIDSAINFIMIPLQIILIYFLVRHFFEWNTYDKAGKLSAYYLKLWKFFYFEILLFILLVASRYLALIV